MTPSDRLRQHPRERLAPDVQVLDLHAAATHLASEPHGAVAGHRQVAIFRHGPVTVVLFAFETGGQLKEHRAEGVVTIHTLGGRLEVLVNEEVHELTGGQVVALAPGIPHTVRALTPSEMLLTVHLLPR